MAHRFSHYRFHGRGARLSVHGYWCAERTLQGYVARLLGVMDLLALLGQEYKIPLCEILLGFSWCWVRWRSCGWLLSSRAAMGSDVLKLELKKYVVRTASVLVRSLRGGIHLGRRFLLIWRNLPAAASAGTAGAFTILNREADGAAGSWGSRGGIGGKGAWLLFLNR
jgi:hypothetical protein